jgi:DNA-binding NarL/FixJ family response regulator
MLNAAPGPSEIVPTVTPPIAETTCLRREILVVDDHPMTRFGIKQILQAQPDLHVLAEANSAAAALEIVVRNEVDLIIADISLPGRNGLELVKDALALRPALKILVCSMHDELLYGDRAIRAGARGFIMKDEGGQALVNAVREVLDGKIFVSSRLSERRGSASGPGAGALRNMSDRELEIFTLIGSGHRTSEIAEMLHISKKTVDTHRSNMREKLALANGNALTYYATHWVAGKL